MRRTCTLALTAVGALALPAGASAATAALDLPCYVAGQAGNLALSGYAPNVVVNITNDDLGATTVTTDATGSATLAFTPPSGNDLKKPGSAPFVIKATEAANPASTGTASSLIAPFAFSTDSGTKSPKALRSWYFSGFKAGKAIYGHFRFGGLTAANYRFGVAKGACGVYKRRAPGIAVAGRVSAGTWTIQIDQSARYKATTKPQLRDKTDVFTTTVPRAARSAAALSVAALVDGVPFSTLQGWR